MSYSRALIVDDSKIARVTLKKKLEQRGLETVLEGRISFVIAHRLSTVRRANRILVITKGQIEESGTHEELLKNRGHYYGLYTSQFRREREKEVLSGEET